MNKTIVLISLIFIFQSCNKSGDSAELDKVKEFYKKAKMRNIDILFNLTLVPRGVKEDGTSKMQYIYVNNRKGDSFSIPVLSRYKLPENMNRIMDSSFFDVKKFAKSRGIYTDSGALACIKLLSDSAETLYNELDVLSVSGSPDSSFIVFQVTTSYQVIYLPDIKRLEKAYKKEDTIDNKLISIKYYNRKDTIKKEFKVNAYKEPYWKYIVKNSNKLDSQWYYRKEIFKE